MILSDSNTSSFNHYQHDIFGILASQIGYDDEAYKYFSQSARMDLDDIHNNFYAGIHAANMAGTWQGIVFGFAGVRSNAGYLQINPKLPSQWKSYEFRLQYKGSNLNIKVADKKVEYTSIMIANFHMKV